MFLRNLGQESPKSDLRLQRYGKNNFRDRFAISGMWLGLYLEILWDLGFYLGKLVDHGLICSKIKGLFVKLALIFGWGFIFE
jgi:hypothetical protein